MKRILLLLMISIFLQSCVNRQKQQEMVSGPQNGSLLIIGGNLLSPEIYAKFLELAGGPEANLVIIPTAIADEYLLGDGAIEKIIKTFTSQGFKNIEVLHTRNPEEANKEEFIKPLKTANAVYFMGGRQWRIADGFLNTLAHKELFKVLDRGGVIGGSSAGASIQGSYLVRGDTKTNVVMMGDHKEGLGFLKNVAIDQHLLELNRQFDIYEILREHPHLLGLGLDENTGVIVQGDTFEVIGESFVAIYDGSFCQFVRDKEDWSIERPEIIKLQEGSERFYLLGKGRVYDLKNRKVIK